MNKLLLIILTFVLTVSATLGQSYPLKIAILGNSIVENGPNESIGWFGNWGMAASARDKDFVHLLEQDLKNLSSGIELKSANIADFERKYWDYDVKTPLKGIKEFSPDILILRIGDNMDERQLNVESLHKSLQNLIDFIANGRSMKVIISNSFWSSYYRDSALLSFSLKNKTGFIDLGGLYDDKTNTAQGLFSNIGVAAHPSDKGMSAIRDKVWKSLIIEIEELFCNYYQKCNYCQEGNHTGFLDLATCDIIKGWVLDVDNLQRTVEVEVLVDDKPFVNLLANIDRPDLKGTYGEKGVKHGFSYTIPAGVAWKDGNQHTIKVKPCWKNAKFLNYSGVTVSCKKLDLPSDYISGWASLECNEIIGWIYDKNNLSKSIKIDFILNDKLVKTYDANINRPDLLPFLSNTPDATKHLFIATVSDLPKGSFSAQIRLNENGKIIGNNEFFQCPKLVLNTLNDEEDKILIYPNPNQGEFDIVLSQSIKSAEIQLFDSFGRECYFSRSISQAKIQGLLRGVYFLKVLKGEKSLSSKIIVE